MKYILILLKTNSTIVYVEFLLLSSCSCCKHLYTCILFYFDLILVCSIYFVVFHFSLFQCSVSPELNQLSSLHCPLKTLAHS